MTSSEGRAPGLTVLVAARNEPERIAGTIAALHRDFPAAEILVVDGASDDGTAERAEEAGAVVIRFYRRGKGEAPSAGEAASPGPLLLVDADVQGDLRPLAEGDADLAVAAFTRRVGGGFGLAKRVGRALIRLRTGRTPRSPSRANAMSRAGRAAVFPLAPGFGCEVRMTIDALRAGLAFRVRSSTRPPRDGEGSVRLSTVAGSSSTRPRGRPARPQPPGPPASARGLGGGPRGLGAPRRTALAVAGITAIGLADDLWKAERGWRAHLGSAWTTGVLEAGWHPGAGAAASGSVAGGLTVGLAANALNQLDTDRAARPRPSSAGPSGSRARAAVAASVAALLPTIFARSRCSATEGRMRSVRW